MTLKRSSEILGAKNRHSEILVCEIWRQVFAYGNQMWFHDGGDSSIVGKSRSMRLFCRVRLTFDFYLRELCCSTVTIQCRISLRPSAQAELLVPERDCYRTAPSLLCGWSDGWNGLAYQLLCV